MVTPTIDYLGCVNRNNNPNRHFLCCKTQIRNVSRDLTSAFDSDSVLVTWEGQDTNGATAPKLDTQQNQAKSNY